MIEVRCFRERASKELIQETYALDVGIGSNANGNSSFIDKMRVNTTTIQYASRNFKRQFITVRDDMPVQLSRFRSFISQRCNGRLMFQYPDYY